MRAGAVLPLAVEFPDDRPHDPGKVTLAAYPGAGSGEGVPSRAFFDDGESWQFRDGDGSQLDLALFWTPDSVRLEGVERMTGAHRPELTITMVDPLARAGSISGDFGLIPATLENRFPI